MNSRYLLGFVILTLMSATSLSHAVGPREPLTFQNMGLYGVWNDYFVSKDSPFDFLIVQALVYEDHIGWSHEVKTETATWNDWLKRARANGKRVIADVCPAVLDEKGNLQTLANAYNEKDPLPVERLMAMFDKFFNEVDQNELYAITLSEENVFWNGQAERLNAAYDYIKRKYTVPAYQWYTPSETSSIPGLNYPNLKADGWMADEYFLKQPLIESALRGYAIHQKPVFQIMWALPEYGIIPSAEKTFWDQYAACRKYDVPVAFYFWVGVGKGPISEQGWDPTATPKMREIFEDLCIYGAGLAKRLPAVPMSEWDFAPWGQKQIKLQIAEDRKPAVVGYTVYNEAFAKERGLQFLADASISGFANLKWDSSPLQFKPRTAGPALTTMRYCFDNPRKIKSIVVTLTGKTQGATVDLTLADFRGQVLARSEMKDNSAVIKFDAAKYGDTRFVVSCLMKGDAKAAGQVLAELSSISVETEFELPE